MQMNKILCLFVSMFSIFGTNCNANDNGGVNNSPVVLEITECSDVFIGRNNKCVVLFGNYFNHLDNSEFSGRTNEATNGRFNASSCDVYNINDNNYNNKEFIFSNVNNIGPCILLLKCDANINPNIVFNCGNNRVNCTRIIGYGINSLRINSNVQFVVRNYSVTDSSNNQQTLYDDANPILGGFVAEPRSTLFELSCISQ